MEHFRDHDIEEKITSGVSNIIEQVLWYLGEEQELYRRRAMEIIEESDSIETAAIGLTLDQQLEIIEEAADDCGYGDLTFSLENLRTELESYAVMFIHLLAENRTYGIFGDLFDFMEEHGLEPEDMTNTNNFGWLAHTSERDEGPCTIYEYRNVEDPGNHVDIWEYRLTDDESVYFEVWQKE